jgi:hypothetical protein
MRLDPGQITLGTVGKEAKQVVGHDDAEDGVSEELQSLIVVDIFVGFVDIGPMAKSEVQKINSPEPQAIGLLKSRQLFSPRGTHSRGSEQRDVGKPGRNQHE